jgi:exodeoxyribonuclease VII small subunit
MSKRPHDAEVDAAAGEEALPFESALARLEQIVDRLEGGELTLEQALESFEQGVSLSRRCAEELARAERRIEVLVQRGEGSARAPFEPDADD